MRGQVAWGVALAVLTVVLTGCGTQRSGATPHASGNGASGRPSGPGLTWRYEHTVRTSGRLHDLAVRAPDDVWALGSDLIGGKVPDDGNYLLHYNGRKWTREPLPIAGDAMLSRLESLGSAGAPARTDAVATAPKVRHAPAGRRSRGAEPAVPACNADTGADAPEL